MWVGKVKSQVDIQIPMLRLKIATRLVRERQYSDPAALAGAGDRSGHGYRL